MVLTHGTPCVRLSAPTMSAVLRAWSRSNHVLSPHMFVALASRTVYADFVVHGSGMPWKSLSTGPYRVDQKVWRTGFSAPSAWRTWTVTSRDVIFSGLPAAAGVGGAPAGGGASNGPDGTGGD